LRRAPLSGALVYYVLQIHSVFEDYRTTIFPVLFSDSVSCPQIISFLLLLLLLLVSIRDREAIGSDRIGLVVGLIASQLEVADELLERVSD